MIRPSKYILLTAIAAMSLISCDDYLDKLPDDRAEVDNAEKVQQLLVSAYPTNSSNTLLELSSDNVADYGRTYTNSSQLCDELYRFEDVTVSTGSNDSPYMLWNACYSAVNTANSALEAITELGDPESLSASKAEAKLCRAFAIWELANVFCMAYNPENADTYPGLPYPTQTGQDLSERGSLSELYEKINQDIEDALPYVTDSYTVPKYHFNSKAAYAFATKFNVNYMKYDKAIEYATKAIGENPSNNLRDYATIDELIPTDKMNNYISSSSSANLLLLTSYSTSGLYPGLLEGNQRFLHNQNMCYYETFWAEAPWGSGQTGNVLIYAYNVYSYGGNYCTIFPKINYLFEYTDKVNGIGYYHIVDPVLTVDETLLYRAEAYALSGQYQKAVDDMNYWLVSHSYDEKDDVPRITLTIDNINEFEEGLDYAPVELESNRDRSPRKTLHPQGFTVASGTQENIIQVILHMRRLEMLGQGTRFLDIKRYGIEYTHYVSGEDNETYTFKAGDLRGAIQIPADVVTAGVAANPR